MRERLRPPADVVAVTPEGVSPVFFGATPLADSVLERFGIRPPFALAGGTTSLERTWFVCFRRGGPLPTP